MTRRTSQKRKCLLQPCRCSRMTKKKRTTIHSHERPACLLVLSSQSQKNRSSSNCRAVFKFSLRNHKPSCSRHFNIHPSSIHQRRATLKLRLFLTLSNLHFLPRNDPSRHN
ncbi:hypothetical protein BLNAU_5469 [Blattamonas nauphoetae]|uniref:Uncharacterized protein n=1 Tax=Blattamonas nauphoetae TaxID=2049346 RepID=A0ABQ9XNM3_9EUKA|nr:hypothetical protein BLNAU_11629 [Blattamonas nauphoetae]KAK2959692.1 hypothetical protein BLNAU_5469 [Blattamonas nauphoetae]